MEQSKQNDESNIKREYAVNIVMNELCLNGDPDCPCYKKPPKRDYNPV